MKLPIIPKCNKNFQAFLHCQKWQKYLTKWLIYIISCVNDLLIVSKVGIAISVSFFQPFEPYLYQNISIMLLKTSKNHTWSAEFRSYLKPEDGLER